LLTNEQKRKERLSHAGQALQKSINYYLFAGAFVVAGVVFTEPSLRSSTFKLKLVAGGVDDSLKPWLKRSAPFTFELP